MVTRRAIQHVLGGNDAADDWSTSVEVHEREQLGGDHLAEAADLVVRHGSCGLSADEVEPDRSHDGVVGDLEPAPVGAHARCRGPCDRRAVGPPSHPSGGEVHRAGPPGQMAGVLRSTGHDHLATISAVDPVEHGVEEVVAVVVRLHAVAEVHEAERVGAGGVQQVADELVEPSRRARPPDPRGAAAPRDRSEGAADRGGARAGGRRSATPRRHRGRGPNPPRSRRWSDANRFFSRPSSTACFRRRISSMVRSAPCSRWM